MWVVNNIYFQYYGLLIFLVSVLVMIVVSHATTPPAAAQLTGLTYATITAEQRRESRRTWDLTDMLGSAVVLFLIAAAYVYFSG
jgi:SSS family solute:Na+ symporter